MSEWQPIETAPVADTMACVSGYCQVAYLVFRPDWTPAASMMVVCGEPPDDATHWMPLPPPPEIA